MSLPHFPQYVFNTMTLRIFQHIEQYQHGDHRILADGMRIWHLECRYCITPVLDGRPQPSYPSCSFRACLHSFLLDSNQSHPMPAVWRNFIWMFHPHIKCSFYTAAIASRQRLWEWFKWRLTNTFMKDSLHTPCIQFRACTIQSCLFHTTLTCWSTSLQYTVIPT